ncbi:hypothetical protein [Actinokineospora pegani]|uniref:hypothetical protein n=1 Tax=Actinokineospora pegani TaxID=2654637 RepID=UPI0012EA85B7|nr:hypothetical protein [Actinokineospora pegani]
MRKALLSAFAGATVTFGLVGLVGSASADPVTATADLDGDGVADTVTARTVPGDPTRQQITATVNGREYTATGDSDPNGVQPLRVTDVNRDGANEVITTGYLGANTVTMTIWVLHNDSLQAVFGPAGEPFYLYEGGGVSQVNGYSCAEGTIQVTSGDADNPGGQDPTYSGEVIAYTLDGAMLQLAGETVSFEGEPRPTPDPQTCV